MMDIPKAETLSVEFKSDRSKLSDDAIIDGVVALANTEGGTFYLGVEDDGSVTGTHPAHRDTTRLAAFLANNIVPPVSVRVNRLGADEQTVVAIEVPKSTSIVATASGRILRRRLKSDGTPESTPLYPHEISSRLSDLGKLDYSALPLPDASIDDFDSGEMARLRRLIERAGTSDRALLDLPDLEVLQALGLVVTVEGSSVPTVTGILLLGTSASIERHVPTSRSLFQVLDGTEVRVNESFGGPLLSVIERFAELLTPWNPEREYEEGMFRVPVPEFDARAFREAVVNAFGHRDYSRLGEVRVLIDDDGLTVSSPGGFIEGVTVRNLLTVEPHGRNPCLMDALKRVGLAERTGRGIDRIYEGSLSYGRPLPDYTASDSTMVRVFIARSAPDRVFMELLREENERTGKAMPIRLLLVLDLLKRQKRLKLTEICSELDLSEGLARSVVEALVESGLADATGSGQGRAYMLGARVYERQDKTAEYIRQVGISRLHRKGLIIELAGRQGAVTSSEVSSMLGVSGKQAYRLLRGLVDEGTLRLEGHGKSARYYPTAKG